MGLVIDNNDYNWDLILFFFFSRTFVWTSIVFFFFLVYIYLRDSISIILFRALSLSLSGQTPDVKCHGIIILSRFFLSEEWWNCSVFLYPFGILFFSNHALFYFLSHPISLHFIRYSLCNFDEEWLWTVFSPGPLPVLYAFGTCFPFTFYVAAVRPTRTAFCAPSPFPPLLYLYPENISRNARTRVGQITRTRVGLTARSRVALPSHVSFYKFCLMNLWILVVITQWIQYPFFISFFFFFFSFLSLLSSLLLVRLLIWGYYFNCQFVNFNLSSPFIMPDTTLAFEPRAV